MIIFSHPELPSQEDKRQRGRTKESPRLSMYFTKRKEDLIIMPQKTQEEEFLNFSSTNYQQQPQSHTK
jgi:hypothetical protein